MYTNKLKIYGRNLLNAWKKIVYTILIHSNKIRHRNRFLILLGFIQFSHAMNFNLNLLPKSNSRRFVKKIIQVLIILWGNLLSMFCISTKSWRKNKFSLIMNSEVINSRFITIWAMNMIKSSWALNWERMKWSEIKKCLKIYLFYMFFLF